jgi:hypothetical protein
MSQNPQKIGGYMRIPHIAAILALGAMVGVGFAALRPALAQTTGTVQGWRQFKFGMTSDQARAASGPSWRYNPPNTNNTQTFSTLVTLQPTEEFGAMFGAVTVSFTSEHGLYGINLFDVGSVPPKSPEACEDFYKKLLSVAETQYGRFIPFGGKYKRIDATTPTRGIAGAKSRYLYTTTNDSVFGNQFEMTARHSSGARYIEVGIAGSANDHSHTPTPPICTTVIKIFDTSLAPDAPSGHPN